MEKIRVKGIEHLDENQKFAFDKTVANESEKLKRLIKNNFILSINIKIYETSGKTNKAKKYSLNAELKAPTLMFDASYADWDFNKCLHKIFQKLCSEVEHKFHVSEQR